MWTWLVSVSSLVSSRKLSVSGVSGVAFILPLPKADLLIGNDILSKLTIVEIIYDDQPGSPWKPGHLARHCRRQQQREAFLLRKQLAEAFESMLILR